MDPFPFYFPLSPDFLAMDKILAQYTSMEVDAPEAVLLIAKLLYRIQGLAQVPQARSAAELGLGPV